MTEPAPGRYNCRAIRPFPSPNRRPEELSPDMKAALTARLAPAAWLGRFRAAGGSAWLPLGLLLLALATAFLFSNDRGSLYRPSHHDGVSAIYLAVADNMAWEKGFLGFYRRGRNADGDITYSLYNRFPVGGYLLIKLFTWPFEGNTAAQIYSARLLMLLAFAGAATLAYLALSRLTGQRWIALIAALLTFASPYWLYSNDTIATEIGLDFFGVMLTFHGMVIFAQEGRFRQLLVKSGVALLLGWHVYALLGPFILLGLAGELIRARSLAPAAAPWLRIRAILLQLFRSRYLILGAATLLFGIALLSFNFANEYRVMRGEVGLTELASFDSMQRRLSLNPSPRPDNFFPGGGWNYWQQQFYRIGGMATPYALPGYTSALPGFFNDLGEFPREESMALGAILGLAATALALGGLALARHKMLWATLIFSGFCWAILVRHSVAYHYFEAVIYTGIPLAALSLLLVYLSRPGGRRFILALAALALLIFGLSSFRMAQVGYTEIVAEVRDLAIADFETIHAITDGHTVAYNGRFPEINVAVSHYLFRSIRVKPAAAEYLILPLRLDGIPTLTPENRRIFLYPGGPATAGYLDDWILAQAGPPLLEDDFAVYRYTDGWANPPEDWLFYLKADCRPADREALIFLHLTPGDTGFLPVERWEHGFANWDFSFSEYSWQGEGRCVAARRLPNYPLSAIRTGQLGPDGNPLWQGDAAITYGR